MENHIFESVYQTILRRDTQYDGRYYVGIVTTGIFCRPSCRSRTPKPGNVRVYGSIDEARRAGFRPCKRCKPDNPGENGPDAEMVNAVMDRIRTQYAEHLTLNEISSKLNISPFHLQRVFKRVTGTTPARHLLQTRIDAAKMLLIRNELPIAEIAAAVGFKSASHFSFAFHRAVGTPPQHFRHGHS